MKNLLIFFSPHKKFTGSKRIKQLPSGKYDIFAEIQIDNSIHMGWKREDIMLVTNFPYEYNGVKAIVLDDNIFCDVCETASKITAIVALCEQNIITDNEIYWLHDFDAYQVGSITEEEIGLGNLDLALTDYGWSSKWNTGSFFFKKSAKDIFVLWKDSIYKNKADDERALMLLTDNNVDNINSRIKRLSISYNFGMRHTDRNYHKALKPLRVLHFHPIHRRVNTIDIFMYGKNPDGIIFMSKNLITLFKKYEFQ